MPRDAYAHACKTGFKKVKFGNLIKLILLTYISHSLFPVCSGKSVSDFGVRLQNNPDTYLKGL